jgi:hypothetical protein
MSEIIVWGLGIAAIIALGCCISWVMEMLDGNSWRNKVMVSDLEELKRLFDEEDAFVGYNDNDEKFLCGYTKD